MVTPSSPNPLQVKLMRQLEEEAHRRQQYEQKMRREMASLQKMQRTKDVQLKNLEVERRKKDAVLKRKIQEVIRRMQRTMVLVLVLSLCFYVLIFLELGLDLCLDI